MEYSFTKTPVIGGIGADTRFWESLEEGVFRMCRCAECQEWMWPALWRCPRCGGWDQEWTEVEPVGSIYSWTRSHYAFDTTADRSADLPYVVVLVELAHVGNARVIGEFEGPPDGIVIGQQVRGRIAPPEKKTHGYATVRWSVQNDDGGDR